MVVPIWLYCRALSYLNVPLQVIGHLVGLVVWFLVMGTINYYFYLYLDGFTTFDEWKEYMTEELTGGAFLLNYQYVTAIFVFYLIEYTERLRDKEQEKTLLALRNQEIQLSLLKSQINPHFLFNTLNSISMLIGVDKNKARKMINQLSDIFRYALDSYEDQLVKVEEELFFIENYVNIQKVRFEDRLNFEKDVDRDCMKIMIPPMVLQPIVENSVKHGISPKKSGGTIRMMIKKNDPYINFIIEDDGLGINANKGIEEKGAGVGLSISDKRLRKLFGEASKLNLEADQNGFKVKFKIPYKEEKNELEDVHS